MIVHSKWLFAGLCAILTVTPREAARAQQAVSLQPPEAVLQEVVVTAQRTESSLQNTPIAVTAVSGTELEARGATTLFDLQEFTPSLQIGTRDARGTSAAGFSIRGIGVDALDSAPAVGIYVDDVYFPSISGNLLGLFDVERIEVLRGPQGTLFGRNTIAGAVQYITVQPGQTLTGYVDGFVGNLESRGISAAVTLPINDTLSTRFAFRSNTAGGYVHDDLNDIDRGREETNEGAAKVRWTPNDRLIVDLKGDLIHDENNGRAIAVTGINPNALFPQIATNPALGPFAYTGPFDDRYVSARNYHFAGFDSPDSFDFKYWDGQARIEYKLADSVSVKSISSYGRSESASLLDFDDTPAAIVASRTQNPEVINLFTQELQFTGRAFADQFHWTGGLYYFHSRDEIDGAGSLFALLPPAAFNLTNGNTVLKDQAEAVYAQGTYNFTPQLSLELGLRYGAETIRGVNLTFPRPPLSNHFNNTSPLVGLNFQATDDILIYAKASEGYRAGGFSISSAIAAGFVSFQPETAWTYESGARLEFLDRRLRVNPTIYLTDWKNIQFAEQLTGTAPDGTITPILATGNAGDAHIRGAELEAQYQATTQLEFMASLATTSGHYTRIAPGIALTDRSPLQRAPSLKYSLGARYTYLLAKSSALTASIDWSHTSVQRSQTTDADAGVLPAYGLLNARLRYTLPGGTLSISAYATNLTNTYYYTGVTGPDLFAVTGAAAADLGRPREYGISARYAF